MWSTPRARAGCAVAAALFAVGGGQRMTAAPQAGSPAPEAPEFVRQRCTGCHAVPDPARLPRDQWTETMELMVGVMKDQAGVEYTPQELQRVLIYYRANSLARLPELPVVPASSPPRLVPEALGAPAPEAADPQSMPTISNVSVVDLDGDGHLDVVVCDALGNRISWIRRSGDGWAESVLAEVAAPAATAVGDFDDDGDSDLVVASLGSLFPTNEPTGSVVLLVNEGAAGFEPRVLLDGVGRLADVEPGDLDGDGDVDFTVAVFGHVKLGGIGWLENRTGGEYVFHWLLEEPGGLTAPMVDLEGDGDLDVVALVAQAAERIVGFVNEGDGRFRQITVFDAGTPSFGSSGMTPADMDGDGDLDLLHTNGDSFDVVGKEVPLHFFQRPYHGVRWIENRGDLTFATHEIRAFYGAFGAAAGDLDGDGDTDVFAVSMFNDWADPRRQSAFWFENDGEQGFRTHGLGSAPTHLVTADLGDLDGDGRLDAVTGGMHVLGPFDRVGRVTWWRNVGESDGGG